MNKFKVGDRVRVNNTYNESCHVGSEGTITVVPDQVKKWFYDVDLNIDPIAFLFEESEIDLVEPTVSKFKVGDRVRVNGKYIHNHEILESPYQGREGTITVVPDQAKKWYYRVEIDQVVGQDDPVLLLEESEIDLVEPTVPTAKFKVGDRVNLNDPAYTLAPNQQVGTVKCLTTPYIVTVDNFGGDLAFFEFELTPFVDTPVVEMSVLEKIVKVDSALRQLVTEGLPTDAAAAVESFLISARLSDLARLYDLIVA